MINITTKEVLRNENVDVETETIVALVTPVTKTFKGHFIELFRFLFYVNEMDIDLKT